MRCPGPNPPLWASWVLTTDKHRVFFSGDTGLTTEFEEIGRRHGPFDLVMLEVGAFHPSWGGIHLGPENALKALQYMACGVPCVATPFGAVCDIIQDDVNGLLAETPGAWRMAFEQLRDPSERQRIGEAGRRTVEEKFSLRVAAPKLLAHLEAVAQ